MACHALAQVAGVSDLKVLFSCGNDVLIERVFGQGCSAVLWPSCQPSNASITIGKAPRKMG